MQAADADKLVLSAVLGRGTWGTVYKGMWRNLPVAVKTVLFSESQVGALPMTRAITEAAVCASVSHRNVVATYHYDFKPIKTAEAAGQGRLQVVFGSQSSGKAGTEQSGGSRASNNPSAPPQEYKLFLVQELCSTTLSHALKSCVLHDAATLAPDMELVLALLLDVARGLGHLHGKAIMHGDLKPQNVMLKMDANCRIGVVAKLTDFGLAATMDPAATHISNYNSGTPFYAAPEVASSGHASCASDLYSFGVLMWEVLRCTPPWVRLPAPDGSPGGYAPNPLFPRWDRGTPARYSTLAARCLEEDPKARPPISEVIAQLTCMLEARDAGYESLEAPGSIPTGASLEGAAGGAAAASGSQNAAGNGSQAGPVYCEAGAGWQGVAEGPSGRQLGPGSGGQAGGGQCTGGSTAGMQPAVEQHAGQQPVEHPALVEQATGWSGRQAGVGAQAASVPAAATSAARPESAVSVPSLVRLQALVADADTTPGQGS